MDNLICHFCKKSVSEEEACIVDIKASSPSGEKDILSCHAHQECAIGLVAKLARKTPFSREDLETKAIITCTESNPCAICQKDTKYVEYHSFKPVCSNECYDEVLK